MKKKVIILGAGISGLSAAFALRETHDILVIEKEKGAGGWCEKAARTFRSSSSKELLSLAEKLGIEKEILSCSPEARSRYLFFRGKLEKIPMDPIGFFRSPLLKGIRGSLLSEWRRPACEADETLFAFAARRFGSEAAERFFDALAIGVYGTEAKKISVETAFPILKEMERNYGSLVKALLLKKKSKKTNRSALFSFRGGTKTLIAALTKALQDSIHFEEEAIRVEKLGNTFEVFTNKTSYKADAVIVALSPKQAGGLLDCKILKELEMTSLCMVRLGYEKDLLPFKGFGVLVPSREQMPLLGVIFDSCLFPSENEAMQTRLTAMLPLGSHPEETAISFVRDHLKIAERPSLVEQTVCKEAIFLPQIGHKQKMEEVLASLPENLLLAGNYLDGVSVNDCIRSGFTAAKKLQDGF